MILKIITTIINEIIAPSVEGYILITLLFAFGLEQRFKFKHSSIVMILEYVLIISIVYRLQLNKGILDMLFCAFLVIVITHINFAGNVYKKMIYCGLFNCILLIGDALTLILLLLVGINGNNIFASSYYYMYAVIVSIVVKLLLLKLTLLKVNNQRNIKKAYLAQVISLVLFSIIACSTMVELYLSNVIYNNNIVKSTVFLLCINILIPTIVISIFTKLIKETIKQAEQQQLFEQYKLEHKYSKELNKILDNLRILKHDLKNHISCMWGLVETDNIEDFKLYLSNLTEELEGLKEDGLVSDMKSVKVADD